MKKKTNNTNLNSSIATVNLKAIWRAPSLSELTPIIFDMELTHKGLESSI